MSKHSKSKSKLEGSRPAGLPPKRTNANNQYR
jgi:hypothetical protein